MTERSLPHLDVADPLHELTRAADPVAGQDLASSGIQLALDRMLAETRDTAPAVHESPATRRWQRRIAGVSVGTALTVATISGAAAATGVGIWVRFFDSPSSTESIRDEAYISTGSPEFAAAFDRADADYPLPAGQTRDGMRHDLLGSGALKQVTGLRGELALGSTCPWSDAWVAAESSHDPALLDAASDALHRIAVSPDLAAVDGGGIVEQVSAMSAAAQAGDAAAVAELRSTMGCESDR